MNALTTRSHFSWMPSVRFPTIRPLSIEHVWGAGGQEWEGPCTEGVGLRCTEGRDQGPVQGELGPSCTGEYLYRAPSPKTE